MGWWSDFDRPEVAADFARIAASGLDSVRIFLTWADFQPAPNQVDRRMLDRLIAVADLAAGTGMALIPTLFTGHMSGVDTLLALDRAVRDGRVGEGDNVLLLSAGTGYTWAAAVIRWGEE